MPYDAAIETPGYFQAYSGLFLPKGVRGRAESSSRAVQVNDNVWVPKNLDEFIVYQLSQSRRKYFIFHEMYRLDTWIRGSIDYIVNRVTREPNRFIDKRDPLNPDIEDLEDFLDDCNPDLSWEDIYKGIIQDKLEFHQAYLYVEKTNSGAPYRLWPLDSRITFPVTDFHGTILFHAQVYNGNVEVFEKDEILYFPVRNNGSNPNGLPKMETLFDSFTLERAANAYNSNLFVNGLNIGAIISIPGATDEDIEENRRYLEDQYATPKNAHRPLLLRGDAKLLRDGAQTIKDLNFNELISLGRARVCTVYGVPESLLGIPENTNRSEGEVHERQTYVTTCRPIRRETNGQFSKQFIGNENMWANKHIKLYEPINSMLPTNQEIDAIAKAAEVGLMYNDILEMMGFPRVPNGDYFVMKGPNGTYQRLDLTAMPGLGDPHFDFDAYYNEHMANQAMDQANAMTASAGGMQPPSPMANSNFVMPRSQDLPQTEAIAARIVDVSRSMDVDPHDILLELWTGDDVVVSRRIPTVPGARGASTLYYTSSGKARYGTPPRGKQPPLEAPDGSPNNNTLTNPKDPNMPKRLSPEERLQMASARGQVEGLFRQSQQDNWTNEEFMSNLDKDGWQKAADTTDQFQDARLARNEARRLSETYPDKAYVILGSDGQYFIMEKSMSDVSSPGEQRGVGEDSKRGAPAKNDEAVAKSMPSLDDWKTLVRAFTGGSNG